MPDAAGSPTVYEVELKFPLPEAAAVLERLGKLGAVAHPPLEQCDLYFRHPARDFAATREAFRLRRSGEENRLTYKGPVVDTQTKMRHEIEIPFASGDQTAEQMEKLLKMLGFAPARRVRKVRHPYTLPWQGAELEVVIDAVEELGRYLEIETLADESGREQARERILSLAEHLHLPPPEMRSYLSMLLEKDKLSRGEGRELAGRE